MQFKLGATPILEKVAAPDGSSSRRQPSRFSTEDAEREADRQAREAVMSSREFYGDDGFDETGQRKYRRFSGGGGWYDTAAGALKAWWNGTDSTDETARQHEGYSAIRSRKLREIYAKEARKKYDAAVAAAQRGDMTLANKLLEDAGGSGATPADREAATLWRNAQQQALSQRLGGTAVDTWSGGGGAGGVGGGAGGIGGGGGPNDALRDQAMASGNALMRNGANNGIGAGMSYPDWHIRAALGIQQPQLLPLGITPAPGAPGSMQQNQQRLVSVSQSAPERPLFPVYQNSRKRGDAVGTTQIPQTGPAPQAVPAINTPGNTGAVSNA